MFCCIFPVLRDINIFIIKNIQTIYQRLGVLNYIKIINMIITIKYYDSTYSDIFILINFVIAVI